MFDTVARESGVAPRRKLGEAARELGRGGGPLADGPKAHVLQALCAARLPLIVHCPLEVPEDWLHKFDFIDDSATRQTYHAMVAYMDQVQPRPHISNPNFFALSSPHAPGGGECHDADSSQGQHVAEHPHRSKL